MILCLSCRRLSASGSVYCTWCRRSLGARRCPKGHASPRYAKCCRTCGSRDLSEAASSIRLRWLGIALGWLLVLGTLRLAIQRFPALLSLAWWAACALGRFLFGDTGSAIIAAARGFLNEALALLLIYTVFALAFKKNPWPLWRGIARLIGRILPFAARFSLAVFRFLKRLVQGPVRSDKEPS